MKKMILKIKKKNNQKRKTNLSKNTLKIKKKKFFVDPLMNINDVLEHKCNYEFIIEMLHKKLVDHVEDIIEIESRLGTLIDVFTGERLRINSAHPILLEQFHDSKFKSGVPENDFTKMKKLFENENSTKISDKVTFYKGFRKTVCDGKITTIKKKRIAVFDIYMPKHAYDLRIAVSRETPVDFDMRNSEFSRSRERESFQKNNLQFDFTVTVSGNKKQYEIETEMLNSECNLLDFLHISMNFALLNK